MEKSFNNRTPVICQNPRHPKTYGKIKLRWILVPMCEYKVSMPYPKENVLNLFQETVLKLLISGNKTDEWIAAALCLNKELIEYVVKELIQYGLIDERRRVTEAGRLLIGEETNTYDIKSG